MLVCSSYRKGRHGEEERYREERFIRGDALVNDFLLVELHPVGIEHG